MVDKRQVSDEIRISNPFEYLGPLSNPNFFFDRRNELHDSLIVCEQIMRGLKGGVLVVGGRGSGKTSFLEALRRELYGRGIACMKLPLNQGLVDPGKEIQLFKTILSEMFKAAQESNLLERGLIDKIRGFIDGMDVGQIGIDLPGIKFMVKSSESEQTKRIPYIVLRDGLNDFLNVLKEKGKSHTKHGAIVIFDEGDVLTLNKDLLQVLRNVFQETPKLGLVVAGSTKLLERVSEVFSPVPRFFHKIELGQYPSESIVDEAIDLPLEYVRDELLDKGFKLDIVHSAFNNLIKVISARMPMEINLLSHFAFDIGARHLKFEEEQITLYMKVDKNLMDEAISQLRGTREYDSFLNDLDEQEVTTLRFLSKTSWGANLEELTVLLSLNELGERLQTSPLNLITGQLKDYLKLKGEVQKTLNNLREKGQKFGFTVVSSSLTGNALFQVEDQMMRSYFRYGWRYQEVDLELGVKPNFGGIRMFGDPNATIVHSVIFPRMARWLGSTDSFRAHIGQNNGEKLRPARGRTLIGCTYERAADGKLYHIAFQLKNSAALPRWKQDIQVLVNALENIDLLRSPTIFVR